jgi:hypothetical protein
MRPPKTKVSTSGISPIALAHESAQSFSPSGPSMKPSNETWSAAIIVLEVWDAMIAPL